MRRSVLSLLLWFAGAGLLAWILLHQDWGRLGPALAGVGWGLLLLAGFHLLPMAMDTRAWRCLLATDRRPGPAQLLYLRWLGESVNTLLPAAQVGGDLLRGRLLQLAGVPAATAAASVVVNLTLTVASLLLFILLGILLLGLRTPQQPLVAPLAGGLLLAAAAIGGFFIAQRAGFIGRSLAALARLAGGELATLSSSASLNQALDTQYARHRDILRSAAWSFAAWLVGAGEIWLAFRLLGADAGWLEALMLESLIQAIRNTAFLVPGALGVQDGGAMLAAPLAGVAPETALLISLLKRCRELLLGLPGLAAAWLSLARAARSSAA